MKRTAWRTASSAWAIVAYLSLVLFTAPCTCLAVPAGTTDAAACCCGPDAPNPCAPASGGEEHESCGGHLGAGCAHALPEIATLDAEQGFEELSAPVLLLSFELATPERAGLASARARSPRVPTPRLDQVRSTVLLI